MTTLQSHTAPTQGPRTGSTALIWNYARPHWRTWVALTLLGYGVAAAALAQPWVVKVLIDHVFTGRVPARAIPVWIAAAALIAVGLAVISGALEMIQTRLWVRVGYAMAYELAATLFAILQRKPQRFHRQHTIGDLLGRVTGDSWCVYRMVDACVLVPGRALLVIVCTVAVMLSMDPWLTLATLAAAPLMAAMNLSLGRRRRANARRSRDIDAELQAHVHQTLNGIDIVQAFAREDVEHRRFQEFAERSVKAQQRGALLTSLSDLASGAVTTAGTGLVLLISARHVLHGTLDLGSLVVFLAYLTLLYDQMKAGMSAYLSVQTLGGQIHRVAQVLEHPSGLPEPRVPAAVGRARGAIAFDTVTAGYEPGVPALSDVSFEIKSGETLAIVGRTGAGKSTAVSLIPRFMDVWSGRVTLDGVDVREYRVDDLRRRIAVVFQEPFLLPMSIADNIRVGNPSASEAEVRAAAVAASAAPFIARLPAGYDTVIGERGATLSGGERQRIAIARAILRDAPVVILDEPTSAVDARTEDELMQAIARLTRGRTTILIAHRLSTVRHADRIAVLERGRLVEIGTRAELVSLGSVYARMDATHAAPLAFAERVV